MYTRITNKIMLGATKENISDSLATLYELQRKATSGKRYATASENPSVAAKGISLRSTQRQLEVYQNTMSSTNTWLETTDNTLQKMVSILTEAQGTVLQALNDTQSTDERRVAGAAIDGMIQQMLDLANTEDRGRYIFAGLKTDTVPFVLASGSAGAAVDQIKLNMPVVDAGSGSITLDGIYVQTDTSKINRISINGTSVEVNLPQLTDGSVNPDFPTMWINGEAVIPNPPTTGSPVINVNGIDVAVDFSSGSPSFSVAGSAVAITGSPVTLTPANSVTIGFTSGSFTFTPAPVTSGSVTGDPNSMYVNGIKISVQDPLAVPPTFLVDGQIINMGTTGYVNLSNVNKYDGAAYGGHDPNFPSYTRDYVIYQGDNNTITRNIGPSNTMSVSINGGDAFNQVNGMFNTLIKLRDILNSEDYISPHESSVASGTTSYQVSQQISDSQSPITNPRQATVFSNENPALSLLSESYGQLQSVSEFISEQLSAVGTKMKNLDNAIDHADTASLQLKSMLSQNEEVNMAEAAAEVVNQKTVYDAVLAMSGKISNLLTLFDKI
ncbi:MAG: flagellar hook-associated protein FlgL [Anaerolineae bacterium]|nr:flagellar hook-associated protein FlgL [Anaerolineae bacterium]